jgi:hypothetical protein
MLVTLWCYPATPWTWLYCCCENRGRVDWISEGVGVTVYLEAGAMKRLLLDGGLWGGK